MGWSPDGVQALSGGDDNTVRVWEVATGRCLRVLEGHSASVLSVGWSPDGVQALSGAVNGVCRVWEARIGTEPAGQQQPAQVEYTNAKVLLVGESGAEKTAFRCDWR